jgi:hypothetical protein
MDGRNKCGHDGAERESSECRGREQKPAQQNLLIQQLKFEAL